MNGAGASNLFQSLSLFSELGHTNLAHSKSLNNKLENLANQGSNGTPEFSQIFNSVALDPQILSSLKALAEKNLDKSTQLTAAGNGEKSGNSFPLSQEELTDFLTQLQQYLNTEVQFDEEVSTSQLIEKVQGYFEEFATSGMENASDNDGVFTHTALGDYKVLPYDGPISGIVGDGSGKITPVFDSPLKMGEVPLQTSFIVEGRGTAFQDAGKVSLEVNFRGELSQDKVSQVVTNHRNLNHLSANQFFDSEGKPLTPQSILGKAIETDELVQQNGKLEKDPFTPNLQKGEKFQFSLAKDGETNVSPKLNENLNQQLTLDAAKNNKGHSEQVALIKNQSLTNPNTSIISNDTTSIVKVDSVDKAQTASTLHLQPGSEFTQGLNLKREFAPNLMMRIQWMLNQSLKSAEILMDPPEMGPLSVKVQQTNGETSILFQVSNSQTKDVLDDNMQRLKEMLSEKGILLSDAQVEQQNSKQQNSSQQQTNSSENEMGEMSAENVQILNSDHMLDVYS